MVPTAQLSVTSTGSSLSSEPSPVSSPATNHSSPASTPKRVPMGPIIVPPGGHSVPSTPPVVTIAPTKTVNGVWRSESRQVSGLGPGQVPQWVCWALPGCVAVATAPGQGHLVVAAHAGVCSLEEAIGRGKNGRLEIPGRTGHTGNFLLRGQLGAGPHIWLGPLCPWDLEPALPN